MYFGFSLRRNNLETNYPNNFVFLFEKATWLVYYSKVVLSVLGMVHIDAIQARQPLSLCIHGGE